MTTDRRDTVQGMTDWLEGELRPPSLYRPSSSRLPLDPTLFIPDGLKIYSLSVVCVRNAVTCHCSSFVS